MKNKIEITKKQIRVNSRQLAVRKPTWLKVKYTVNDDFREMREIVREHNLHTVCEEARCPNQGECWRRRVATLMILGDTCTRNCRFCAVGNGKLLPPDPQEPIKVGKAVRLMGLKYAVITSVTRDDLPDGGANHWAQTIREIRRQNPGCKVEVLVPDFKGNSDALDTVLAEKPDVFGHNLETIERLYPKARPQADYRQSLAVLEYAKKSGAITKTGIMVGLGESDDEITDLLENARSVGCDICTAGQYLQPTKEHLPVDRYVTPEKFKHIEEEGLKMGFRAVLAGPLVRSSYHAEELL
ncbi:MAG: lipoyl synthase [Candidatus Neomarinimicrobiota bacterium]|nr:MAG: lipoyl synthase [Candidatus Neomarinimicrobiota bacterium]